LKFVLKVFIQYLTISLLFTFFVDTLCFGQNVDSTTYDPQLREKPTRVSKQPDTLLRKQNNSMLTSEVDYQSADTIESFLNEKRIILKGNAKVVYEDIELTAAYIDIDFTKNEIYAKGYEDSLGNLLGYPVFKEGTEVFESSEIRYNFKTQKGIITNVITEQDGGFLHSKHTKKHNDNIIDLKAGKYTTCDHEHPHYFIAMSKARVIQNDKIISGPLYLVIEDIPTPLAIPFGFFPFTQEKTSGLIIPSYGDSDLRGFSLEDLGYYWAFNDYFDLKVLASIYSKGSFEGMIGSRYKKRYRYNGKVSASYEKIIEGERGLSDEVNTSAYHIIWDHKQDPKANPNSTFSASVNLKNSQANRYSNNMDEYIQNSVTSSVNYSHSLPGTPFSVNAQARHTLNSKDTLSTVSMVLPSVNLNMKRITPFDFKNSNKPPNIIEKIGITYKSRFENKFEIPEEDLFKQDIVDEFRFGVKHDINVSTTAKMLKFLTLSPYAKYTERWYFNSIRKKYENALFQNDDQFTYGKQTVDTISGFNRVYDYSVGASVNTTVYGLYTFQPYIPIEAIRFVHTPSIGYKYTPDFGVDKYGYYGEVIGKPESTYSYYDNGIYGTAPSGESGSISLALNNQVGMKVRTPRDTANTTKKIDLLKQLNFSTNYDIAKDSMNWSALSIRASTNLFQRINITANATMDPYALDPITYGRIDKFQYAVDGKIGRITNLSGSVQFSIDSKMFSAESETEKETEENTDNVTDYYDYFDIPWSFSIGYNYTYRKPGIKKTQTQAVSVRGDFSLTSKWKINVSTGFDFENKEIQPTTFNIVRDLHCWVATFQWVPFPRPSYSVTIGVKASILQDLKWDKKGNSYDNYAF
jgi:lipopolysaccharide assembly outer membrane protein LptD (OstA)